MKRGWWLLPWVLLAGCRGPEVYLAPGVPFRIRPAALGPALSVDQEVTFVLPDGRRETALASLEIKDGRMVVVASTGLGQTLLVVTVEGDQARAERRIPLPGDLDPRALAGLVQLCLWPADDLRQGLANPATALEEAGTGRVLRRKGKPVWVITREGAAPPYRKVVLENPSMRLRVEIRTLEP